MKGAEINDPGLPLHHPCPGEVQDSSRVSCRVRSIESVEEIEKLELSWRKLTGRLAAPFQTFTWNLAWYRHFTGSYDSLMVFLVERGDEMVAILPCYRQGRQIRLAADRVGDYQDVIATNHEDAFAGLNAVFNYVSREFPAFSFYFWKISSEGYLHAFFNDKGQQREEMITVSKRHAPCPVVKIRGGLEPYLASLPGKRRQDMRRSLRRLDKGLPGSRVVILRGDEIRVSDLENVAFFHIDYFRKDGVSPLEDKALLNMLGEASKDPGVGLQVSALVDRGEMVAVDIGFVRGKKYYGYLTGFDPAFRSFAPGKCLLLKRIDIWTEKDGVETLDFLSGDEPYKTGFTHGESYHVDSVHWMPNRVSSRARQVTLVAGMIGKQVAKKAIRKVTLPR
ncbi:MAG: GNAT family N-acetyltransferase [Verrucomicrobiales bacterium]|nr:GNAT family N-acetyltransferase [Verrucomicrobiales bacterium]